MDQNHGVVILILLESACSDYIDECDSAAKENKSNLDDKNSAVYIHKYKLTCHFTCHLPSSTPLTIFTFYIAIQNINFLFIFMVTRIRVNNTKNVLIFSLNNRYTGHSDLQE